MVRAKERMDEELSIQHQHQTKPPDQHQQTWAPSSCPSTVITTQTHNKTSSFCTLRCRSFLYSSICQSVFWTLLEGNLSWGLVGLHPGAHGTFQHHFTLQKFGVGKIFERNLLFSSRLHLLDQKYSNIVKCCYNLNYLFAIWIYCQM